MAKQVAVITGAASGIGFALSEVCLQQDMHLVMADKSEALLHEKAASLSAQTDNTVLSIVCDVTDSLSVQQLALQTYAHFHRVDWLFNNAGISGRMAPVWELSAQDIRDVMEVNLYGVIHGLQAFLPLMIQQTHRSHVINMASVYGLCSGSQMAAYAMSKHALIALSESLYFDLQRLEKPVDVSVACPSFVSTGLLDNSASANTTPLQQVMSHLIERSRPAMDVALHIVQEIKQNRFYILPDKEVKNYCEQRTNAIIEQTAPHAHSLEKLLVSLSKRSSR